MEFHSDVQDFIWFVAKFPRDQKIDHSYNEEFGPWGNCAVGLFLRDRNPEERWLTIEANELQDLLIDDGFEELVDDLNHSRIKTFGELSYDIDYQILKD